MNYLIDDDISVRGFDLFLKSASLELKSFERAEDFQSEVKPKLSDILIIDIHLHGMSGTVLLKKLEQENIHISVIIVTAFDNANRRKSCRNYGVKAYLRKPIDGEVLIDIIKFNLPS